MLIGDLIYNDDFDVNCNFTVYEGQWNNGGTCLWNTSKNGYNKLPCALLDEEIGYITINANRPEIIIEIKEN